MSTHSLSQRASPGRHLHVEPAQYSEAEQAASHAPHASESARVSLHVAPHVVTSGLQTQVPPEQISPAPHAFPQPPQCSRSVDGSTHAALVPLPHAICVPGQTQRVPRPSVVQIALSGQGASHAPQWSKSCARSTQASPQRVFGARHGGGPVSWPTSGEVPSVEASVEASIDASSGVVASDVDPSPAAADHGSRESYPAIASQPSDSAQTTINADRMPPDASPPVTPLA